jgi:hypothetical protein
MSQFYNCCGPAVRCRSNLRLVAHLLSNCHLNPILAGCHRFFIGGRSGSGTVLSQKLLLLLFKSKNIKHYMMAFVLFKMLRYEIQKVNRKIFNAQIEQ